ncbi:MAG: MBL fold metallo-hydrolase [Clostridia bacterium]
MKVEIVHGTLLRTNNILIGNEKSVILIDPSASKEKLQDKIAGRDVLAVLLTHGHWDHFQTLDEIINNQNCKCYLTFEAYQKIKDNSIRTKYEKKIVSMLSEDCFSFIEDEQILSFENFEIKIFRTSGHTNCSVSYLINPREAPFVYKGNDFLFESETTGVEYDGSILISGDTLFKGGQGRTDLPTGNQEEIEKSISKLLSLPNDLIVIAGHGEITTIGEEKKLY